MKNSPPKPRLIAGLQPLWLIFAAFLFGAMSVFVNLASAHMGTIEMVFYRSAIGIMIVLAAARLRRRTLATPNLRVHFWRSLAGFVSLTLFFYALPKLPLSSSMALLQTSPLFFAALTAAFLRERFTPGLVAALAASFCGMLLILRPGADDGELYAGMAALGAGAAAGCAYFNIRRLGILNEGGIRTVFYFALLSAILSLALIVPTGGFSTLTETGAAWALAIGVTATLGQFALTQGLHSVSPPAASSLMYIGIVFAGIFDYALWGGTPDAVAWAGIALISGSGIAAVWIARRQAPRP